MMLKTLITIVSPMKLQHSVWANYVACFHLNTKNLDVWSTRHVDWANSFFERGSTTSEAPEAKTTDKNVCVSSKTFQKYHLTSREYLVISHCPVGQISYMLFCFISPSEYLFFYLHYDCLSLHELQIFFMLCIWVNNCKYFRRGFICKN